MTLRYTNTNLSVGVAGTQLTHGITVNGVSTAPDEWKFNYYTSAGVPAGATAIYRVATTSTTFTIASTSGTAVIDFFCQKTHSLIG